MYTKRVNIERLHAMLPGMDAPTPYYLGKLREQFSQRQRLNKHYSLRAFARDVRVHPSTLSLVLLGKRPLPFKVLPDVMTALSLNAKERTLFAESLGKRHLSLDRIRVNPRDESTFLEDEIYFQVIAEWEHYAAFTLFDCDGFHPSADRVATALGITPLRAQVVLDNLVRYGLLKKRADKLEKAMVRVRTSDDVASAALQASHQDTLMLGSKKLKDVPVELRDFSSLTVAVDLEKLPEAKTIIREFRRKMAELLKTGSRTEVFQLAIQFFPLTQIESETNQTKRGNPQV